MRIATNVLQFFRPTYRVLRGILLLPRTIAILAWRMIGWLLGGWFGTNQRASRQLKIRFPVEVFRTFGYLWAVTFLTSGSNIPTVLGTGFAVVSGLALLTIAFAGVAEDAEERRVLVVSGRRFFVSALLMIVVSGNVAFIEAIRPKGIAPPPQWIQILRIVVVSPFALSTVKLAVDGLVDVILALLHIETDGERRAESD